MQQRRGAIITRHRYLNIDIRGLAVELLLEDGTQYNQQGSMKIHMGVPIDTHRSITHLE